MPAADSKLNADGDEGTYKKAHDPYFSPESLPPRPHFPLKEIAATGILNNHLGINSVHFAYSLGKFQQLPPFSKQLEMRT